LASEAVGEVELDDNVLVIRRIHVVLKLKAEESHRETATVFMVSSLTDVRSIAR